MLISRTSRSPIGIDVGSRNIKAAQLCSNGKGPHRIATLSVIPRADVGSEIDPEEAAVLRHILTRQGFHGPDVVLTADDRRLLRTVFEVPGQICGSAAAQIARMELARAHSVAPDSLETICWDPVRGNKPQSTAQAFALGYPHDAANALMDTFEDAGFNVCAIDARSSAVVRACRSLTLDPPAITAVLDVGWTSTRLLFACGNTVVYERLSVGDSISTLATNLCSKLNIPESAAEKVFVSTGLTDFDVQGEFDRRCAEFIQTMLDNHFNSLKRELKPPLAQISRQRCGGRAERMLLVGSGAMIPGIAECLKDGLKLEVLTAAPVDVLPGQGPIETRGNDTSLTISCGLAMFEID